MRQSQAEEDANERRVELEDQALEVFKYVVAEWESDPLSVQCFDLRIVRKAQAIRAELAEIDKKYPNRLI